MSCCMMTTDIEKNPVEQRSWLLYQLNRLELSVARKIGQLNFYHQFLILKIFRQFILINFYIHISSIGPAIIFNAYKHIISS